MRAVMGVDEAGRGPVLGPLVICAAVFDEGLDLAAVGARDSKQLTPGARERLDGELRRLALRWRLDVVPPEEIDARTVSLNDLELDHMARLVAELAPGPEEGITVYVDAVQRDCAAFEAKLRSRLPPAVRAVPMVAENKADARYPVVGAASIIAKVARDAAVRALAEEYGDVGSGYPSDPATRRWLARWHEEHGSLPSIVRGTWATTRRLLGEGGGGPVGAGGGARGRGGRRGRARPRGQRALGEFAG